MSLFVGLTIKDEDKYKYNALEQLIETWNETGLVTFEREAVLRMIRNLQILTSQEINK